MSVLRRRAVMAGSLAASLGVPAVVKAQADWPKGTIKFIVPFPPGGNGKMILTGPFGQSAAWAMF